MAKGGSGSGRRAGGGGLSSADRARIRQAIVEDNERAAARDLQVFGVVRPGLLSDPDQDVNSIDRAIRQGLMGRPQNLSNLSNSVIAATVQAALSRLAQARLNAGLADLGRRINAGDQNAINVLRRNL